MEPTTIFWSHKKFGAAKWSNKSFFVHNKFSSFSVRLKFFQLKLYLSSKNWKLRIFFISHKHQWIVNMLLITFPINFPASAGMKSLFFGEKKLWNLFRSKIVFILFIWNFEMFKCQNVHFVYGIRLHSFHLISSTNEEKDYLNLRQF